MPSTSRKHLTKAGVRVFRLHFSYGVNMIMLQVSSLWTVSQPGHSSVSTLASISLNARENIGASK